MHSAIIYVVLPSRPGEAHTVGPSFRAGIARLDKFDNKLVRQIGESVWEIDFQEAPDALAVIVSAAESLGLPYGILPLADALRWILRDPQREAGET